MDNVEGCDLHAVWFKRDTLRGTTSLSTRKNKGQSLVKITQQGDTPFQGIRSEATCS